MISRITYRALTTAIAIVAVLSVAAFAVSLWALARQSSVAEKKADQAIAAATQGSSDTSRAVCTFVLTFVVKPGGPPPTTARGRATSAAARVAYAKLGCATYTGPLPPEVP